MKLARIALAAALGLPCAATATPRTGPLEAAGPHRLAHDQLACQFWQDIDNLTVARRTKDRLTTERIWAQTNNPEALERGRLCMVLRKGTTVRVVKRPVGYECVQVRGHPLRDCLYTENVSGITTTTHEPVFSPWDPSYYRP
ncbi:hypothetical protein ABID82_007145 [Methylobacterium sp. PvP062]|uniref:Uncharacterized protein n=1 Tax=Methylobacterium radiotolerans TaxID=31998 RepID=A0ABV2NTW7_9HYPH|nr:MULTISPECIES: hypothetical protein [unclassified Methylobacterium]MBP2498332.1 hypothetical protein [Methylobacterium sp. PvP105]MBP2505716.1 hypothetical protein [Methylobacterium sp. PvP109]